MLCYALTLILLTIAGKQLMLGYAYYAGLMGAAFVAVYHYFLIRSRDRNNCFNAFLHNNWFGFAIFAGLFAHFGI
jgi:4-hydroxybenzoate polyprenyltransferase